MAAAIHIEINVLFLMLLVFIVYQSKLNINQQMRRILFRYVLYGVISLLSLDTAWMLVDGKIFPGAITLNKIINAFFLGGVMVMGCLWYLYVLDTLNVKLTKAKTRLIMLPGTIGFLLNIASIWTGWIFYVTEENIYVRGPWFPLQIVSSLLMLFVSLIHLVIRAFRTGDEDEKQAIWKLLSFYIVPVIGTVIAMPFTGMPGTWTCAAISLILIYMTDQEEAILRDSLTGLNNRKNLQTTFRSYTHQITEVKNLYLFMMDLNNFKAINDQLGHTIGDQALVEAAHLLTAGVSSIQGIVARYGGDEFIVMGFFYGEPNAISFKKQIKASFEKWNEEHDVPYTLSTSIGFSRYKKGQKLDDLIRMADEDLYRDKRAQM